MKKPSKPIQKKTNSGSSRPRSSARLAVDQIPLDLLCDMTHQIIRYKKLEDAAMDPKVWSEMATAAAFFITLAKASRDRLALTVEGERLRGDLAEAYGEIVRSLPDVKTTEKQAGRMNFSRGCKRITGLSKREDAERRFYFALPHLKTVKRQPFEHYQKNGFLLEEVGMMEAEVHKLSQKSLRKPYERTGNFRRNKQGRKKSPKK
jgi:hypothetical protein